MPRYLHDHSTIYYRRTADLAETGYEVRLRDKDELVGHVRPSKSQPGGWAYQVSGDPAFAPKGLDQAGWWVAVSGTRKDAADHLLSAYSPSAHFLV
jgi:hypothetical protein